MNKRQLEEKIVRLTEDLERSEGRAKHYKELLAMYRDSSDKSPEEYPTTHLRVFFGGGRTELFRNVTDIATVRNTNIHGGYTRLYDALSFTQGTERRVLRDVAFKPYREEQLMTISVWATNGPQTDVSEVIGHDVNDGVLRILKLDGTVVNFTLHHIDVWEVR